MKQQNDEPKDIFASRLQQARAARELSQQELAEKSGLPPTSISHFERGGRRPSFDNLKRLANALNVTTDFLIGRTDDMQASGEADALHRDLNKLTDADRTLASRFIQMLAEKDRGSGR